MKIYEEDGQLHIEDASDGVVIMSKETYDKCVEEIEYLKAKIRELKAQEEGLRRVLKS